MPSFVVRFSVCFCAITTLVWPQCALAGWQQTMVRSLVPLIARKTTTALMKELYDVEEPAPKGSTDNIRQQGTAQPSIEKIPQKHTASSTPPIQSGQSYSQDRWHPKPAYDYLEQPEVNYQSGESDQENSKLTEQAPKTAYAQEAVAAFISGGAGDLSYEQLVRAGIFKVYPMRGGTYARSESIKYVILHSTETGSIANAQRVIQSWSNRGPHHPGAQFVVDRDGTIYSTIDPAMATVHINTKKTLSDYSNDNSIGIEVVRAAQQRYKKEQLDAVTRLVAYLQTHYGIPNENVTTHGHVQPTDRSDPVGFDMNRFLSAKALLLDESAPRLASSKRTKELSPSLNSDNESTATSDWAQAPLAQAINKASVMPPTAPDFRVQR